MGGQNGQNDFLVLSVWCFSVIFVLCYCLLFGYIKHDLTKYCLEKISCLIKGRLYGWLLVMLVVLSSHHGGRGISEW